MKTKPVTMFLMMLAGWINREQQHMIEYLREENSILRDELSKATGRSRVILNDSQRRRLAIVVVGK
jgi:type I site-specific restriction endonuclease